MMAFLFFLVRLKALTGVKEVSLPSPFSPSTSLFGHTEADALRLGEEEHCIFRILPGKKRNVEHEELFKVQNCCECTDILSTCFKIN